MDKADDNFLKDVTGVVHVGANSGQERDQYEALGLAVIWVEAIAEVYDDLVRNISSYRKQKAFCQLLADKDGLVFEFNVANNSGASSSIFEFWQHKDIWPQVDFVSRRPLKSLRLDTLLNREKIDASKYAALVMDVQGAELLVLKGAGNMLRKFRYVKAEAADFESYKDCAKLQDLRDYLRPYGFKEISRKSFAKHPAGGEYWDVVWQRKDADLFQRARNWFLGRC